MGNIRREKKILRRNKVEMLQSKNNAFDKLISRLNATKGRISGLEDMSTETSKVEKQKKKKKTEILIEYTRTMG